MTTLNRAMSVDDPELTRRVRCTSDAEVSGWTKSVASAAAAAAAAAAALRTLMLLLVAASSVADWCCETPDCTEHTNTTEPGRFFWLVSEKWSDTFNSFCRRHLKTPFPSSFLRPLAANSSASDLLLRLMAFYVDFSYATFGKARY